MEGLAQRAQQLTFSAEVLSADAWAAGAGPGHTPPPDAESGGVWGGVWGGAGRRRADPGGLRAAWDEAAEAWAAAGQPYPLAAALLRAAEAALMPATGTRAGSGCAGAAGWPGSWAPGR